jgi:gas vesicle protein
MSTEERFEHLKRLTAELAEERRKNRDEFKTLWRDTQRQINELSARVLQFGQESQESARRHREADSRLEARIKQLAEESREADRRLEAHIESLVSVLSQFLAGPK